MRPVGKDFCVNVHLDTVHLDITAYADADETKVETVSGSIEGDRVFQDWDAHERGVLVPFPKDFP